LIPFTNGPVLDISQFSRELEDEPFAGRDVLSLVVLPSHDTGATQKSQILAGDLLVRVETEDLDSFEEDPGHSQAFPVSSHVPLGETSSHDPPRAPLLRSVANHGLMSRRF
jgi:hypothetical protein